MIIRDRVATVEDLRAIEVLPENKDRRFELVNGVIFEVPYPSPLHNLIIGNIYSPLREFVKGRNLGYVFTDSVSYSLPTGDLFAPDVSFMAHDRVTTPLPKQFMFAPNFAVEVASPSNWERELLNKAEALLKSGTSVVWIVYPTTKVVDVCHLSTDGTLNTRKAEIEDVLEGETPLDGFTLKVRDIFEL